MRLILIATAAALSTPAAAETREVPVTGFTAVSNETAPDVLVRVGGPASVRVEGDRETIDALRIAVEGDALTIKSRPGFRWPRRAGRTIVYVTAPRLASATVEGSGNVRVDRVTGGSFSGSAHGSGNLMVDDLRTDSAALSSHGSGNVAAAGAVGRLQAFTSGSGNVDVSRLQARTGTVRTTGSGNIEAAVSDLAEVVASGSGRATVTGAKTCRVRSTGSGGVSCG